MSLIGTGLTTVASRLLAYELASADAGAGLKTALPIKMVAYVTVSPFAGVLTGFLPRRTLLAVFVLVLPFVTEIWQI